MATVRSPEMRVHMPLVRCFVMIGASRGHHRGLARSVLSNARATLRQLKRFWWELPGCDTRGAVQGSVRERLRQSGGSAGVSPRTARVVHQARHLDASNAPHCDAGPRCEPDARPATPVASETRKIGGLNPRIRS